MALISGDWPASVKRTHKHVELVIDIRESPASVPINPAVDTPQGWPRPDRVKLASDGFAVRIPGFTEIL